MERWKTAEELKEKYPGISIHMLHSIVASVMLSWETLLFNDMPTGSFGHPRCYHEWCEKGGLKGLD